MEHVALNVADVKATAKWYVDNFDMNIVSAGENPPHATFLTDSAAARQSATDQRPSSPVAASGVPSRTARTIINI